MEQTLLKQQKELEELREDINNVYQSKCRGNLSRDKQR
jgi:hypothetical protein